VISFIMMALNEESRISDAISVLIEQGVYSEWELIIIDDGSVDKTFDISSRFSKLDSRVKVFKNIHKGKVLGTGYGYSLCSGDYIKCIDADDVLLPDFFNEYNAVKPFLAHCHSLTVTDEKLSPLALYAVNTKIVYSSYKDVAENLVSLPKAAWTFHRSIADKIFPIPHSMPIEDVWISLIIKYYAKDIKFTLQPLYLYRQHQGQDYGGIINYERSLVVLRAQRSEKIINVLEQDYAHLIKNIDFKKAKIALALQTTQASMLKIVSSRLPISLILKVSLMLHFPKFASAFTKIKWKLDERKN